MTIPSKPIFQCPGLFPLYSYSSLNFPRLSLSPSLCMPAEYQPADWPGGNVLGRLFCGYESYPIQPRLGKLSNFRFNFECEAANLTNRNLRYQHRIAPFLRFHQFSIPNVPFSPRYHRQLTSFYKLGYHRELLKDYGGKSAELDHWWSNLPNFFLYLLFILFSFFFFKNKNFTLSIKSYALIDSCQLTRDLNLNINVSMNNNWQTERINDFRLSKLGSREFRVVYWSVIERC